MIDQLATLSVICMFQRYPISRRCCASDPVVIRASSDFSSGKTQIRKVPIFCAILDTAWVVSTSHVMFGHILKNNIRTYHDRQNKQISMTIDISKHLGSLYMNQYIKIVSVQVESKQSTGIGDNVSIAQGEG